MQFKFASNQLARRRIGRNPTLDQEHIPLRHNITQIKRQNSSPTKINKTKTKVARLMSMPTVEANNGNVVVKTEAAEHSSNFDEMSSTQATSKKPASKASRLQNRTSTKKNKENNNSRLGHAKRP